MWLGYIFLGQKNGTIYLYQWIKNYNLLKEAFKKHTKIKISCSLLLFNIAVPLQLKSVQQDIWFIFF